MRPEGETRSRRPSTGIYGWVRRPRAPSRTNGRPDIWLGSRSRFRTAQPRESGRRQSGKRIYDPWNFRGWWDFGTGSLGDMGCHYINTPYRALKLTWLTRIHATATRVFEESAPLASIVTYDFPARKGFGPVRVIWYDGGLQPPFPREMAGEKTTEDGVVYIGSKGKMLRSKILTPDRAKKFANLPKKLPRRPGVYGEWMIACQGGEPAGCNFDWAGPLTDFVLLGNIAIRTGATLIGMRHPAGSATMTLPIVCSIRNTGPAGSSKRSRPKREPAGKGRSKLCRAFGARSQRTSNSRPHEAVSKRTSFFAEPHARFPAGDTPRGAPQRKG